MVQEHAESQHLHAALQKSLGNDLAREQGLDLIGKKLTAQNLLLCFSSLIGCYG